MNRILLLILLVSSIKPMEEEQVVEAPRQAERNVPALDLPAVQLENLAQAERHHSMTITMTEDDIFGPLPVSPKTIRHQQQMRKLRWGLAISIISGVGMTLAAFFGAFFGRPCG